MNTETINAVRELQRLDLSLPRSGTARQAPASAPAPYAAGEDAARAAIEANRRLAEKGAELAFEFEDALGRMIFKLVDTRTREVVRQVPSEAMLAIARALADQVSAGALLQADA